MVPETAIMHFCAGMGVSALLINIPVTLYLAGRNGRPWAAAANYILLLAFVACAGYYVWHLRSMGVPFFWEYLRS